MDRPRPTPANGKWLSLSQHRCISAAEPSRIRAMPGSSILSTAAPQRPATGRVSPRFRPAAAAARRSRAWQRLLAHALLALTLVLAQIGALAHVVGHLGGGAEHAGAATAQLDKDDAPADRLAFCAECLALGGIDLPLAAQPGRSPLAPAAAAPRVARTANAHPTACARPRCRAPPTLV